MLRLVLAVTALVALLGTSPAAHAQASPPVGPVIGVLTQATSSQYGKTYIAASYVKYLESAGARVVPVYSLRDEQYLTAMFSQLNGLFIPGGGADLGNSSDPYLASARTIYNLAQQAYANGDYFPIWGTCLGFQTLCVITAGQDILSTGFDSENLPIPLNFTASAATSRMYSSAPKDLFQALATQPITMNNHHDGVTPSTFASNAKLSSFYTVLSTNVDREGRPFVSSIEATSGAPVYATQWHPEKNSFEWTETEQIPHSAVAVQVTQYMSKFFVDECRKSKHVYDYTQLMKDVIWNFNPIFTNTDFVQTYYFNS